ncbi:MAG: hypothetical protein ACXVA9_00545, partial [Bdellovibrionales bacterium]
MNKRLFPTLALATLCLLLKTNNALAETKADGGIETGAAGISQTPQPGEEQGDGGDGATAKASVSDTDRIGHGARCSMTYANVKSYLVEHKMTKERLAGVCAWQAADILPRSGFEKTDSTLANAKPGEVCVFGGSRHMCDGKPVGTIAVKTADGWFDG